LGYIFCFNNYIFLKWLSMEKETIAAFDFDGTITTKDTLFDFIYFYWGKPRLIVGLIILSPVLVLYKIGIINNSKAKEILFSYYFKNQDIDHFNMKSDLYSQKINIICRKSILQKIEYHKNKKDKIIIVSASISNWIKPWALETGIEKVFATEIQVEKGKITGIFKTKNCFGQEKVNRLLEEYPNRENYILYAYGDSNGDKELLAFSDYPTLIKK